MPFIIDAPQMELKTGFEKLRESGKYSDLTIKCDSRDYLVHKAVVCPRADFFDAICSSSFIEAQTGVIDLSEDDAQAVEHMINYFYHLDYDFQKIKTSPATTNSTSAPPSPRVPSSPRSCRRPRRRSIKVRSLVFEDPLLAQATATTPVVGTLEDTNEELHDTKLSPEFDETKSEPEVQGNDEDDDDMCMEDCIMPSDDATIDPPHEEDLVIHARVYALAEKYGIPGLKSLARRKFLANLPEHIAFKSLSAGLVEVYESTIDSDRGLRDPMMQLFRQNPELAYRDDVQITMSEIDDLHLEIERVVSGMPAK